MNAGRQASLFEEASTDPALSELGSAVVRRPLTHGAWVDLRPGWIVGADELFSRLSADVPWRDERRTMYDRVLDVPRLLCHYGEDAQLPHPLLDRCREALGLSLIHI